MGSLRRHLTYSNVVATLSLFLVLAGATAVAVSSGALEKVDVLKTKSRAKLELGPGFTASSKTIYSDDTFKLKGRCTPGMVPAVRAVVELTTETEHSSADGNSDADADFGPGDVLTIAESSTNAQLSATYQRSVISATAPGGAQLTGIIGAGSNMSDADCVFNLALLG